MSTILIKYLDKLNNIKNRYSIPYTPKNMKEEHYVELMYEELSIEMIKEIERLNKRILTLEETIRRANNNVLKDIAMIKTHEMIKQEIVQRLFETSKMLEKGSD